MIKLIATDLDGTLINKSRTPPLDFQQVWNILDSKGVHFIVASGRDYTGAAGFFGGFAEKMMFICDNGANIFDKGVAIETKHIPKENVHKMLSEIDKIENADPMLCGTKGTYVTAGSPAFMSKMATHYSPLTWVDDLYSVDDDIFKVSVYDATGDIKNHTYLPLARIFENENTIHMSANIWVDIMDKSADKGIALEQIQKMFGISKEETMSFGDFYNDEPLFDRSGYPVIMENAPEDLKEKYPLRAPSNADDGVTKYIWDNIINK